MIRSWSYLRRGLLGIAFVGSLGFGATQAFAAPEQARSATCSRLSGPTIDDTCARSCQDRGFDWGYCTSGYCVCKNFNVS